MTMATSAPKNEPVKAAVSASPALALFRQRVPVERGGHGPWFAGYVEQDGGDGAAEQRAPVDAREHDDRRGRRHREGERQQDRDAVGAAKTRQHADQHPQNHADEHQRDVHAVRALPPNPCISDSALQSWYPLPSRCRSAAVAVQAAALLDRAGGQPDEKPPLEDEEQHRSSRPPPMSAPFQMAYLPTNSMNRAMKTPPRGRCRDRAWPRR